MPLHPTPAALIDRFITALWLEDGLAANSQAAYRRDLQALALWLQAHQSDGSSRERQNRNRNGKAYFRLSTTAY